MNRPPIVASALVAALIAATKLSNPQTIPVRTVAGITSTDSGVVRSGTSLRAVGGGVLVNDAGLRRLIMLDSTLKGVTVLADTSGNAPNLYSTQIGGLIPWLGDSSLYLDYQAQALIVVDPLGKFGRVMAPPKPSDLIALTRPGAGVDPRGRLVYRGARRAPPRTALPEANGAPVISQQPDSAGVVRSDFETRLVDTVVMFHIPVQKMVTVSVAPGSMMGATAANPIPVTDEWALLPDGTIAVVRAQDYHIDWVGMDGKITSTPKMPFDWKRVTLEEKQKLLDSLKQAAAARDAKAAEDAAAGRGRGAGDGGRAGRGSDFTRIGGSVVVEGPPPSGVSAVRLKVPFVTVEPSDLPDYYPPIRAGQVRADFEGNVWILPTTSALSQGSVLAATQTMSALVYDVVGRDGAIRERVKLPEGRSLAGFGRGGVVYMSRSPVQGVTYLERGVVKRN